MFYAGVPATLDQVAREVVEAVGWCIDRRG